MKTKALILFALLAAWSCSSSSHEPVCGAGDSYTSGGATYCFASSTLVIETGFQCPIEAPNRFEGPSGVVCAPAGVSAKDLPKELCGKAGDETCAELKLVSAVDGSTGDASVSQDATIGESDGGRCIIPEQWFVPGCEGDGPDEYVVAAGGECLETCESESCGPGRRCAMTSVKPACVEDGCDACANHIGVCVDDYSLTFSGSSSVDGNGIVVWSVSSGSPDYGYVYGRFTVTGGTFSLQFDNQPPPDALNTGKLGVGFMAAVSTSDFDLHAIAEGQLSGEDEANVNEIFSTGDSGGAALSCNYAIVYTEGDPAFRDWVTLFDPGYSCAKLVPAGEGETFDTYEPVDCGEVKLEELCNVGNWT